MNNEEKLAQLLEAVMSKDAPVNLDRSFLNSIANETMKFVSFEKGEYLTHMGLPVERLLVLLNGQVSVLKYSHGGISIRSGISEAPQIYGLYEALDGIREHSVTLQAATKVCCAVIPPAFFLQGIKSNHKISLAALSFLAKFIDRMLDRSDQLTLNSPYENLLIYLFEKSVEKPLPLVIDANKTEIAELLNISNRSLYRHLEQFEDEGLIERVHGKIVITKSTYTRILEMYDKYRKEHDIP